MTGLQWLSEKAEESGHGEAEESGKGEAAEESGHGETATSGSSLSFSSFSDACRKDTFFGRLAIWRKINTFKNPARGGEILHSLGDWQI